VVVELVFEDEGVAVTEAGVFEAVFDGVFDGVCDNDVVVDGELEGVRELVGVPVPEGVPVREAVGDVVTGMREVVDVRLRDVDGVLDADGVVDCDTGAKFPAHVLRRPEPAERHTR
jgi:hypothetical protein